MYRTHVFPYGITLREGSAVDVFPAAEVRFKIASDEQTSLFLVIDSGAAISALPGSDAAMFGIDVERGIPMTITGINGPPINGWKHDMVIGLGEDFVRIPLVFLEDDTAPRILGRAGIFDRYIIVFEEYKRRSSLLGNQTSAAGRITKIIDGVSS